MRMNSAKRGKQKGEKPQHKGGKERYSESAKSAADEGKANVYLVHRV